jgi:hypothetical protein
MPNDVSEELIHFLTLTAVLDWSPVQKANHVKNNGSDRTIGYVLDLYSVLVIQFLDVFRCVEAA